MEGRVAFLSPSHLPSVPQSTGCIFKLTWWELVINFEREQKHLSSAFSEDQKPSYFWDVFSAAFVGEKQGLNHALPNEAIFISLLLSLAA